MAKYSYELKKKIVTAYLNGEGGFGYLAKTYGIAGKKNVMLWIDNYKNFGDDGLMCSRKQEKYFFEKKLYIVELYLSSEISYRDLAIQEGITNPSMIVNWVKLFRTAGPEGLRPHKKGRKPTVDKQKDTTSVQPSEIKDIDTSAEHVKELEDELYKLRLENAFLKELRRLRLEDEAKMTERCESSAVSEDS